MISHPVLQQLFNQVPMMFADLGCIVAALVLWRRAPLSSVLILLACGITLALLIVYPFAWAVAVRLVGGDAQAVARIDILFGIGWAVVGAISTTLLVFAVYAGRKQPNTALEPTPTAP